MSLSIIFLTCSVALMATGVVAVLTRNNIKRVRANLNGDGVASKVANLALLNMCLLLAWVVILQGCVDVAKGASLSEFFSVVVFYVALAALLFNKLRSFQEAEPI